jgi:hypothetical protein
MAAMTIWKIVSQKFQPVVGRPSACAMKVPMKAPTMPMMMVSQIGMFCLPGTISRAMAPMMRPNTIAVMMPVTVMYFSRLREGRPSAARGAPA